MEKPTALPGNEGERPLHTAVLAGAGAYKLHLLALAGVNLTHLLPGVRS